MNSYIGYGEILHAANFHLFTQNGQTPCATPAHSCTKKIVGESEADVEPTWKRRNMKNNNPTEVEPEKCSFPQTPGMNFYGFQTEDCMHSVQKQVSKLESCGCKFSLLSLKVRVLRYWHIIMVPARLQAPKVTHATPLWTTDLSMTLLFLQNLEAWPSLSWHS